MVTEQVEQEGAATAAPELVICRSGTGLAAQSVVSRLAVVGMSGSGKTQTARKLAEAMMDLNQHIGVFDPTGAWWGLRSSADGLYPGYPIVVFGDPQGDVPMRADAGAMLAKVFLAKRFNAIFGMRGWPDADVRRFMTDFLNEVNRHNKHPLHLFLDEFDIICPQAKGANTEECRATCNTTVRRGRLQGLGVTMITQNPQDADKSVLNMADTVIAMRTQGSQPVEAIKKWMGRGLAADKLAELVTTLGELPTGSGWLWSPQNKIFAVEEFLLCKTFDSSKTPALGETIAPPKVLAAVDLAKLGAQIAASVEQVKQESPEYLRRRIAELEAELAAAQEMAKQSKGEAADMGYIEEAQAAQAELERMRAERGELEARAAATAERLRNRTKAYDQIRMSLSSLVDRLYDMAEDHAGEDEAGDKLPSPVRHTPEAIETVALIKAIPPTRPVGAGADAAQSGPAQRILGALAKFRGIGVNAPSKMHVCLFSGYSNMTSKGFANAISALRTAGLVDYPGDGAVTLTAEGLRHAPAVTKVRGNDELHTRIFEVLSGPEARILRPLLLRYPRAVTKETLMQAAGYTNATSKGFANSLSRLRTMGFLDYPSRGEVVATAQCFVGGAR